MNTLVSSIVTGFFAFGLGCVFALAFNPNNTDPTLYYKLGVADACLTTFENRQGLELGSMTYQQAYDKTIEWRKNEKPVIVPGL